MTFFTRLTEYFVRSNMLILFNVCWLTIANLMGCFGAFTHMQKSNKKLISSGVHQESVLSPFLFEMVYDRLKGEFRLEYQWTDRRQMEQ